MYPILIKIGSLGIHSYGFMISIAFLVGILISIYFAKKEAISAESILDLAIWVILGAIVGARLLYVAGQWDQYKNNLLDIFMLQKGGLAFLGGFILVLLIIVLYARAKKINLLKLLDVLAPGAAIGYSIARIGCFLNGCCFGYPTDSIFGISFPLGSLAYSYFPHTKIHPTQLYALFSMLLVFFVMLYLWKHKKYDGYVFFWWLLLYAAYRFSVEFFRYCPPNLYFLKMTPGQVIAIGLFIVGAGGLYLKSLRR